MTDDGSPSLRLYKDEKIAEMMHQTGGAAKETVYIYGEAISQFKNQQYPVNHLVMGLGLGYIELLMSLLYQDRIQTLGKITSFEKDLELQDHFKSWLSGASYEIYDRALSGLQSYTKTNSSKDQVIQTLNERMQIRGELSLETLKKYDVHEKYQVICYDAFSSHTDSSLWSEEFLTNFLEKFADQKCVFATYASTSLLKKVLKNQGFKSSPKAGFDGKREATLAIRS